MLFGLSCTQQNAPFVLNSLWKTSLHFLCLGIPEPKVPQLYIGTMRSLKLNSGHKNFDLIDLSKTKDYKSILCASIGFANPVISF